MSEIVVIPRETLRSEITEVLKSELGPLLSNLTPASLPNIELLTRKDAASFFGVSLPTLDEWTKNGVIPAYRIGSCVRFKRPELEASLSQVKSGRRG